LSKGDPIQVNTTTIKTFFAGVVLALAPAAQASIISYNFGSVNGSLGNSHVYTVNGVAITAYGFTDAGSANGLYGKSAGGSEVGLGLTGSSDHEIETDNFVQLDMKNVWAVNPLTITLSIGSVQSGEGWAIYGSNTLDVLGKSLLTGTTDYPSSFNLSSSVEAYRYISVQATGDCGADVLLSTLNVSTGLTPATVPEPGSYALMGFGLIAIAGAGRLANNRRRGVK
jgi:hypothetical protein